MPLELSADQVSRRLAVLGALADDRDRLRRVAVRLLAEADVFVEAFYAHLRRFPDMAVLLRSDETVERLKRAQARYFEDLVTADIDPAYVGRRLRVGAAHHRVGLKPKWYIAAFSHYLTFQLERIDRACAAADDRAATAAALVRAVFFDMSLALDAYGIRSEEEAVERSRLHADTAGGPSPTPAEAPPSRRAVRGRGIVIDDDNLAQRLAFIDLDDAAREHLAGHAAALGPYVDAAVDRFHALLGDGSVPLATPMSAEGVRRLGRAARAYWRELAEGRFDRAYAVSRVRVGMVHEQLGVTPQWYVLAMGLQLATITAGLLADGAAPMAVVSALLQAAMFDMTYVIDAYMEARIAALVEMHGFAAHVLQQMTTGLLLVDDDDRVESANWSVIRLLGLAAENLKGLRLTDAVPGLAPELVGIARRRREDDEVTQTLVIGSRRCRVRLMNVRDERGGRRLATLVDDLTTVLDFLSQSEVHERRLEQVVDELSIAVWEADAESGMIEYLTDPIERFLPNAAMRLLGCARAIDGLVHPSDHELFRETWDRVTRGQGQLELEYRLPGDEQRWVHGRMTMVRRGPQERRRVRGDMHDVTESVRLRRELSERLGYQRSATMLARKAMDAAHEPGLIGHFLRLLTEPEAATGAWVASRTAGAGWLVTASFDPARPLDADTLHAIDALRIEREPRVLELDGARYLVAPLYAEGSSEAIAVVRARPGGDFPPAFREHAQTLSGIISGFVGRWVSDDSALRRQRLELLGTLASSVAHDLNNVLGIIRLNADVIDDELEDRDGLIRDLLSTVIDASDRGAALTRDILSFARSTPDGPARSSLEITFRGLRRTLRALLPSSITLEMESAPSMQVAIRAAHLEQMVFNLVSNASAIMSDRGTIRVTARRAALDGPRELTMGRLRPGHHAVVAVEDNGPGVPEGLVQRIFDPFFTTTAGRGGTGLGLSAVARIAVGSGGAVEVDRSPLGGARFSVWLGEVDEAEALAEPRTTPLPTRSLRILVADDEPPLVALISRILTREGHSVTTCPDGTCALQFADETFDVIITDYDMPGATGVDVIRGFAARGSRARVFITSGKEVDLSSDLVELGARRLLKPVSKERLLEAIAGLDAV